MNNQLLEQAMKEIGESNILEGIKLAKKYIDSNKSFGEELLKEECSMVLMESKFNRLQRKESAGSIDPADSEIYYSQITKGILETIMQLQSRSLHSQSVHTNKDVSVNVHVKIKTEEVSIYFAGDLESLDVESMLNIIVTLRKIIEEKKGRKSNLDINDIDGGSIKFTLTLSKEDLTILEGLANNSDPRLSKLGFLRLERNSPEIQYPLPNIISKEFKKEERIVRLDVAEDSEFDIFLTSNEGSHGTAVVITDQEQAYERDDGFTAQPLSEHSQNIPEFVLHDALSLEYDNNPGNNIKPEQWIDLAYYGLPEDQDDSQNELSLLISPRRKKEAERAYAVLVTDEDGFSFWLEKNDISEFESSSLSSFNHSPIGGGLGFRFPKKKLLGFTLDKDGVFQPKRFFLKLISWPARWLAKKALAKIVRKWELNKYGDHLGFSTMKEVQVDLDINEEAYAFNWNTVDWKSMDASTNNGSPFDPGKKSLLLFPGTFGDDMVAFGGMARIQSFHRKIWNHYVGRIVAFNHLTAADSCTKNVDDFIAEVKKTVPDGGITLYADILTRSRGVLVWRQLLSRKEELKAAGIDLHVNKVFSIAPPHLGTPLANADQLAKFLKFYTLFLSFLPPSLATMIVKILAWIVVTAAQSLEELPGIVAESELPSDVNLNGNKELEKLIKREQELGHQDEFPWASYISDYEPKNPKIKEWLEYVLGEVVDKYMKGDNDMVIPVLSSFGYAVDDLTVIQGLNNFNHIEYITQKRRLDLNLLAEIAAWFLDGESKEELLEIFKLEHEPVMA